MLSNPSEKLQGILMRASTSIIRDYEEIQHLQRINPAQKEKFAKISIEKSTSVLLNELYQYYQEVNFEVDGIPLEKPHENRTTVKIEPLNGRENFLRGIKDFAICVAFIEANLKDFEMIHVPIHQMTYWAKKDAGAYSIDGFIKKRRLLVSTSSIRDGSIIGADTELKGISFPSDIRSIGCPALALCYVAAGNWDAAVIHKQGQYPTGSLIVQEAGGVLYHQDKSTVASNGKILNFPEMTES